MTDSEMIKAFGRCFEEINRQKAENEKLQDLMVKKNATIAKQEAEIERLTDTLNATINGQETLQRYVTTAKAETIREFAERLREKGHIPNETWSTTKEKAVYESDIDNLLKEMVGDDV